MQTRSILAAMLLLPFFACNQPRSKMQLDVARPANVPIAASQEAAKDFKSGLISDSTAFQSRGNADQQPKNQTPAIAGQSGVKPQTPAPDTDWDKKIVKTANMDVEVKNFGSFTQALRQKVTRAGGYIAQEELSQSAYQVSNTIVIKVPVGQFDALISQLPSDSDKVVQKRITAEDVTMQIVDTKSRLQTKKEVRERYLELLRQAKKMEDIIAVRQEIDGLQEEMDGAAGRIAYLSHSASYSTINLVYRQVLDVTVKENDEPSFFHQLRNALYNGWQGSSFIFIQLLSLWPLLIIIAGAWIGIRRYRQNVRTRIAGQNIVSKNI